MKKILFAILASSPILAFAENIAETSVLNPEIFDWKVVLVMIPAAISDAINPCAFAIMFILLSSILQKYGSFKKVIWSGLAFSLAVFISYSLMGLGLFTALAVIDTSYTFYFKIVVGTIGILIGLFNIKDFFWYGRWGFVMEVPKSWRPKMNAVAASISSPIGAFFTGILLSLFLLPCSSGPYIVIVSWISSQISGITPIVLAYIGIYNLIFVLPMLGITFITGLGYKKIEELSKFRTKNIRILHLGIGLLMLILGIYVIVEAFLSK